MAKNQRTKVAKALIAEKHKEGVARLIAKRREMLIEILTGEVTYNGITLTKDLLDAMPEQDFIYLPISSHTLVRVVKFNRETNEKVKKFKPHQVGPYKRMHPRSQYYDVVKAKKEALKNKPSAS